MKKDKHLRDEIKIVDGKVYVRTYYERVFDVSEIDDMIKSSARWIRALLDAKEQASAKQ